MADQKISALSAATTPVAGTEVLPIVQSGATKKVSIANLTAGRAVGGLSFGLDAASSALPTTFGGIAHFNANDYTYVVAKSTGNGLILNNGTGSAAVRLLNPAGNGYIEFNTGASGAVTSTLSTAGSFVPPAAQGVNFTANTPAAGTTSQLLNDYQEGTWTPELFSTGATFVYGAATGGSYVKVGKVVTLHAVLSVSSHSGGTAGNALFFSNLPFAPGNQDVGGSGTGIGIWAMSSGITVPANYAMWMAAVRSGTMVLPFYSSTNGGSIRTFQYGDISASPSFQFSLTYQTA